MVLYDKAAYVWDDLYTAIAHCSTRLHKSFSNPVTLNIKYGIKETTALNLRVRKIKEWDKQIPKSLTKASDSIRFGIFSF